MKFIVCAGVIAGLPVIISSALSMWDVKVDSGFSYEHRSLDIALGFDLFLKKPILGYGAINTVYQSFTSGMFEDVRGNSNGLIHILLEMGIVGAIIYSKFLFHFSKFYQKYIGSKTIVLPFFVWIIISLMNEPFGQMPFMYLLLGGGIAEVINQKATKSRAVFPV